MMHQTANNAQAALFFINAGRHRPSSLLATGLRPMHMSYNGAIRAVALKIAGRMQ
jgi:hypothetical protein